MLISHRPIFFGEVSVKVFGPFFNQVVVFLLLSFTGFFYISDSSPLPDVSFASIFTQSNTYLLILFT